MAVILSDEMVKVGKAIAPCDIKFTAVWKRSWLRSLFLICLTTWTLMRLSEFD